MTCIVVHDIPTVEAFSRLWRAIGRDWVDRWTNDREVRFRVAPGTDPEAELAVLALAGFRATIETIPGPTEK